MSQITTHVLDTSRGRPAANLAISLYRFDDGQWSLLGSGVTNVDGRIADLLAQDCVLAAGTYKMYFDTKNYFKQVGQSGFYPHVDVIFDLEDGCDHYHIPLLLSPYGYSTYRGS